MLTLYAHEMHSIQFVVAVLLLVRHEMPFNETRLNIGHVAVLPLVRHEMPAKWI